MKTIFILTIFFLTCNWLWDVSNNSGHGWLTNGFWWARGVAVNHLVWYLSIAAGLLLAAYALYLKEKLVRLETRKIKINHTELKT